MEGLSVNHHVFVSTASQMRFPTLYTACIVPGLGLASYEPPSGIVKKYSLVCGTDATVSQCAPAPYVGSSSLPHLSPHAWSWRQLCKSGIL